MMELISTLFRNYYWFGVFIAAISIYAGIWVYKTVFQEIYTFKRNRPYILFTFAFIFLSWYVPLILLVIVAIIFIVWLIQWVIDSFFTNYFE